MIAALSSIGMFVLKLVLLILILGIIILIHEFGHFIWAKKFGVHIYEFSIGMGPLLYTHKGKDNIDYNIRWIPMGGYVSMAGEVYEDTEGDEIPKEKLMCNRPWYQRLIILVAGVVNNFILAIVLLILYSAIWGGSAISPIISNVVVGSAADNYGLRSGDRILEINDHHVASWDKAQIIFYYKNESNKYDFKVERQNGSIQNIEVIPEKIVNEETGEETMFFGLEVKPEDTKGIFKSISYGFKKFGSLIDSMVCTIWGLISGKISINALTGPVGIFEVVGDSFTLKLSDAIEYLVYIIAFLSINVGFINILPFPAFDGGHVLFLIIEAIKGSKVNAKIENICHIIGFALVILLMIIVTINDIIKLF